MKCELCGKEDSNIRTIYVRFDTDPSFSVDCCTGKRGCFYRAAEKITAELIKKEDICPPKK